MVETVDKATFVCCHSACKFFFHFHTRIFFTTQKNQRTKSCLVRLQKLQKNTRSLQKRSTRTLFCALVIWRQIRDTIFLNRIVDHKQIYMHVYLLLRSMAQQFVACVVTTKSKHRVTRIVSTIDCVFVCQQIFVGLYFFILGERRI